MFLPLLEALEEVDAAGLEGVIVVLYPLDFRAFFVGWLLSVRNGDLAFDGVWEIFDNVGGWMELALT